MQLIAFFAGNTLKCVKFISILVISSEVDCGNENFQAGLIFLFIYYF